MMSDTQPQIPRAEDIAGASAWVDDLRANLQEVLVGQDDLVRSLTIGLLTGGHILLEGVPGLAKSLAVSCLAQAVHASFNRLQFTPDLLPSDLVGTEIYDAKEASFTVRKGPIFANFVLADEINRAPAKVQSALLEGMQERTVSIGGETFELPRPFMVLATQNPIEQEGTYPLPEAQLDRFALKVVIGYPGREEELEILDRMSRTRPKVEVKPVVNLATIERARELVDQVAIDARLAEYIVAIVEATREPQASGLEELASYIQAKQREYNLGVVQVFPFAQVDPLATLVNPDIPSAAFVQRNSEIVSSAFAGQVASLVETTGTETGSMSSSLRLAGGALRGSF